MPQLNSSWLIAADWDEDTHELTVETLDGRAYRLPNVPEEEYKAFIEAPSPGKFFQARLKGRY